MVITYGCRDEDDEYDSEDEQQRGLFVGMLQHNRRGSGSGTLSGLMEKLGASMTFPNASGDSDNSDDDGSVCSKSSVASKASQAFKKLGQKMRLGRPSDDSESDSSDSDSDSDKEDSDDEETSDDDMERSISSLAGKAVRKVTGKFSDALRLGRRSGDEDSSDEEEEEDPLAPPTTTSNTITMPSLGIRAFKFGTTMKQDDSNGSSGTRGNSAGRRKVSNEREQAGTRKSVATERPRPKERLPNRCNSTDENDLRKNKNRSPSAGRKPMSNERHSRNGGDGRKARPLSRSETSDTRRPPAAQPFSRSHTTTGPRAQMVTAAPQATEAVWSMNVTEKMLEQATKEGIYLPGSPNKTRT